MDNPSSGRLALMVTYLRLAWEADRRRTASAVLTQLVGTALIGALPLAVGNLAPAGVEQPSLGEVLLIAVAAGGALAVVLITTGLVREAGTLLGEQVALGLEARCSLVNAGVALATRREPGFQEGRRNAEAGIFASRWAVFQITGLVGVALNVLVGAVLLAVSDAPLIVAGPLVAAVALSLGARGRLRRYQQTVEQGARDQADRKALLDVLEGDHHAEALRSCPGLRHVMHRWVAQHAARSVDTLRDYANGQRRPTAAFSAIAAGAIVVTGASAWLVLSGGERTQALAALAIIVLRLSGLSTLYAGIERGLEQLRAIMDFERAFPAAHGDPPLPAAAGIRAGAAPLVAEGVWFTHPGTTRPALRGASLTVGVDEPVAVVGPNGAGKTTLLALIAGLLTPDRGTLVLHGERLDGGVGGSPLAHTVAVALQRLRQVPVSIRLNVALGYPPALLRGEPPDDALVERAIDLVGLRSHVESLPGGLDTVLGRATDDQPGMGLSGGQEQRLELARVLYRTEMIKRDLGCVPVVLLDEPTSALDGAITDRLLAGGLFVGCATVIVTHNRQVARAIGRVAVMKDGEVVAVGPYDRLLADPTVTELLPR